MTNKYSFGEDKKPALQDVSDISFTRFMMIKKGVEFMRVASVSLGHQLEIQKIKDLF